MSRSRVLYSVVMVLSLALVAVGVWRQVDSRRAEAAEPVPVTLPVRELAPTPLTVSLSTAAASRVAPIGSTSFVTVNAAGPVIRAVRVYDGADLVGVRTFDPPATRRVSIQVEVPALRSGPSVLHAEAVGEEPTEVGHSSPVRLRAVPGVVPAQTVRLPGNGRTPRQIAAASGVPLDAITYAGLKGTPLEAQPPDRPLPPLIVATAPMTAVAPAPAVSEADGAPAASLDGCAATVEPSGGRTTVYELTGGGVGFVKRGVVAAGAALTTGDLTPGPHVFVAGTADGPADSAPVSVDVPADCLSSAWDGDASLLDGELLLPEPAPAVWAYLGVDGRPFERYPAEGSVDGSFGVADLAGAMPSLRGKELRMEVWRAGDTPSSAAVRIAQSTLTVEDPTALAHVIGEAPGVKLNQAGGGTTVEMKATDTKVDFSWSSPSVLPTGAIWQVLGRPLPAGDHNTSPPVLLGTGFAKNGAGSVNLSGTGGVFSIPAQLLLGGRPAKADAGALGALSQVPTPPIAELVTPGSSFGTTPVTQTITGSLATLPAGLVPVPIGDVYVRVLPVAGDAVIGDASNTVAVTLPPLDPAAAGFTGISANFDPGHAANYELSQCVRVTGTPPKGTAGFASIYTEDRTWCPSDFDAKTGGGCQGWCQIAKDAGSLVEFVAQVWDYVATAYNTIIDTIVLIAAKFNPYCLTASVAAEISKSPYADAASEGCEAVATVVASVVVGVVLSAFGLPPRLPTSDQILDIAKGNLTALAVAYLEQLGVPCSKMTVDADQVKAVEGLTGEEAPAEIKGADGGVDVCTAMINQAVSAIREEVKKAAVAETANTSGLPVPSPPQQYELEPRGLYQGASLRLVAEPIDPSTPETARCAVTARPTLRTWNVGGFTGKEPRYLGNGNGSVAYNPLSEVGFGPPWRVTLQMAPITQLTTNDDITSVLLTSPCFAPGSLPTIAPTKLKPPLGPWSPGQAD